MRIVFLLSFILSSQVYAITIDIVGGKEKGEHPIAIVPFQYNLKQSFSHQDVSSIIANDLYRCGRFEPMPTFILPEKPAYRNKIDFKRWQRANVPHLVIGRVNQTSKIGEFIVEFELIDVFSKRRILGFSYTATTDTLRQVAHRISDEIYQALTNERGIFNTSIAYVTVQNLFPKRQYHLYISDADGGNAHLMLRSNEPIISPSWSPNGRYLAYVTYSYNENNIKRMSIYIQEILTGDRNLISAEKGLNAAPNWSPDGKSLAMTLSKDGNAEIYIMQLRNRKLIRITNNEAIDTEPEWSSDGKSILFTSNRSGKPHIYRLFLQNRYIERLTFKGVYNARPRLSPNGKHLALLHSSGQGYRIAILNLKNNKLKILTKTSLDESPSFSPNGGMIIYATGSELAAVSLDGRVRQRLSVMGEEVREPAWSPFF